MKPLMKNVEYKYKDSPLESIVVAQKNYNYVTSYSYSDYVGTYLSEYPRKLHTSKVLPVAGETTTIKMSNLNSSDIWLERPKNYFGGYINTGKTTFWDVVNKPSHYNKSGIECIQAIEASMTREEFLGYLKGNVLKYNWRYRYKNGVEDLEKAQWYQNKLLETYKKENNNETQDNK